MLQPYTVFHGLPSRWFLVDNGYHLLRTSPIILCCFFSLLSALPQDDPLKPTRMFWAPIRGKEVKTCTVEEQASTRAVANNTVPSLTVLDFYSFVRLSIKEPANAIFMTSEKPTAAGRSEKTPADSVTDIIGSLEQWQNNGILLWENSWKPEEIRHFHSASIRPAHS